MNHAQYRAQQRYALDLNVALQENIIHAIQNHEFISARRISDTRTLFWVYAQGHVIKLIYSRSRKLIITVLPITYLEARAKLSEAKLRKSYIQV